MNYTPSLTQVNKKHQDIEELKAQFALKVKYLAQTRGISWNKLINGFISLHNQHKYIYPKQQTLSAWSGCSLRTVSRYCQELIDLNLLIVGRRPGTTNVYYLHHFFWDKDIRSWLKHLFKTLIGFPIAWILSLTANPPISSVKKHVYLYSGVPLYYSKDLLFNVGSNVGGMVVGSFNFLCKSARASIYRPAKDPVSKLILKKKFSYGTIMNINEHYNLCERHNMSYFKRQTPNYPAFLNDCGLNLTEAGKTYLAQYPDQALHHALAEMRQSGKKDDPILWLHKVCRSWCKDQKTWPDSVWVEQRFEENGWDLTASMIDTEQPYTYHQPTKNQQQQKPKDRHIRTLEPTEIEEIKKKYKHAVFSAGYAQETFDQTPSSVNRADLIAQNNFRDELKQLLQYNGIEYEVKPFKRDETLAQATANLAKNRLNPNYRYLLELVGEETVNNIERGILQRAEENDRKRKEKVHPLLR